MAEKGNAATPKVTFVILKSWTLDVRSGPNEAMIVSV